MTPSETEQKIDPAHWYLHFTRFRCPLVGIAVQSGWSDFMFPVEQITVNSAEVHSNKKQYQECVRLFNEMVTKNPEYLSRTPEEAYAVFAQKKQEFLTLESTDFAKLDTKELGDVFQKWFVWIHEWIVATLAPTNLAEEIVTVGLQKEMTRYVDPVKDFERFQELQLLFTTSSRPGFLEEYESELRTLARSRDLVTVEKLHYLEKEYGWLGDTGRLDNFWDADEIKKQILVQKEDVEPTLNSQLVEEALAALNADDALRKSVELARTYVHFRTFRTDVCLIFCYRARFLFEEIARRLSSRK